MDMKDSNDLYQEGYNYYCGKGVKQDFQKAIEMFQGAAQCQHSQALYILGDMYNYGKGVPIDYIQAFFYYQQSANTHNPFAFHALARMYKYGIGVDCHHSKASFYFAEALKGLTLLKNQGSAEAIYHLGLMYEQGDGVEKDLKKAREYFQESAQLKNVQALYHLGLNEEQADYEQAMSYYKQAVYMGNIEALWKLVCYYEYSDVSLFQHFYNEMIKKCESQIALKDVSIMYFLADKYDWQGEYEKSLHLYEKAAQLGHPQAMFELGKIYQLMNDKRSKENNIQAMQCLRQIQRHHGLKIYISALKEMMEIIESEKGVEP